jgi:hypothetical protein
MGFGPTLGGIIIHVTGSVLSVFYIATGIHLFYAALIILVIPESLSVRRMLQARKLRRERLEEEALVRPRNAFAAWKSVFRFLHPLEVFYPVRVSSTTSPLKKSRKDWNLFLVAIAYGCTISVMVRLLRRGAQRDVSVADTLAYRAHTRTSSSTRLLGLAGPLSRSATGLASSASPAPSSSPSFCLVRPAYICSSMSN